jgi:hypothetical protein
MGGLSRYLALLATGAAVSILGGCSTDSPAGAGHVPRVETNHQLVANYCEYKASTWSGVAGCIHDADAAQIQRGNSNAARWARGDLKTCLPDAGRFCVRGRLGPMVYPPSWRRLLDERHIRKGKPDPQCGYYSPSPTYDESAPYDECHGQIDLYCQYGAVSRAQLDECQANVTWGQIKSLDTNAANYARDAGLDKCGADSGPFCKTVQPDYNY